MRQGGEREVAGGGQGGHGGERREARVDFDAVASSRLGDLGKRCIDKVET